MKHKVIIDIMYPLYKFAKGETTMAQIKLTPEELRTLQTDTLKVLKM